MNGNDVLRGILHSPDNVTDKNDIIGPSTGLPSASLRTGVVFLHGWSGCRLGPHRMFVKAARRLSGLGCYCLRFDFRGRGESDGGTQDADIRTMISDTKKAVDFLMDEVSVSTIVLLGICSGCKVAIGASPGDSRVGGLALWSAETMGQLRGSADNTRKSLFILRDYFRKMADPDTWRKILSFRVNVSLVGKALFRQDAPDENEIREDAAMLNLFRSYTGKALFIYGSNDPNTRLAAGKYSEFCKEAGIEQELHEINGANHSFYSLAWEDEVIDLTVEWCSCFAEAS